MGSDRGFPAAPRRALLATGAGIPHSDPDYPPYVDGARRWKQLIEERTSGSVEVQIYHTAQLGDERMINEGVLAGSIHAGIGAGAWAGFVPAYNVVELPFLIRSLQGWIDPRTSRPGITPTAPPARQTNRPRFGVVFSAAPDQVLNRNLIPVHPGAARSRHRQLSAARSGRSRRTSYGKVVFALHSSVSATPWPARQT